MLSCAFYFEGNNIFSIRYFSYENPPFNTTSMIRIKKRRFRLLDDPTRTANLPLTVLVGDAIHRGNIHDFSIFASFFKIALPIFSLNSTSHSGSSANFSATHRISRA